MSSEKNPNHLQKKAASSLNDSEDKRGNFRKFLLYIRSFAPFLIAHHPECDKFKKNHTINIGKYSFCIGCFVGYSAALITYFTIKILNLNNAIPNQILFILSLIFIATFILSPLKLTKIKVIKIIQKILIGVGAAFLLIWILNLPNPELTNKIISMFVLNALVGVLNLYHAVSFFSKCNKCDTPFNWGNCLGFKSITDNFKKFKLNNFLLKMADYSKRVLEKKELKKQT